VKAASEERKQPILKPFGIVENGQFAALRRFGVCAYTCTSRALHLACFGQSQNLGLSKADHCVATHRRNQTAQVAIKSRSGALVVAAEHHPKQFSDSTFSAWNGKNFARSPEFLVRRRTGSPAEGDQTASSKNPNSLEIRIEQDCVSDSEKKVAERRL